MVLNMRTKLQPNQCSTILHHSLIKIGFQIRYPKSTDAYKIQKEVMQA